jgi:hypothetical protein
MKRWNEERQVTELLWLKNKLLRHKDTKIKTINTKPLIHSVFVVKKNNHRVSHS